MNAIQAEQLRQAALSAQGGFVCPQAVYLKTNPMAFDSYAKQGGKSAVGFFTKVLALGAAIVFRKNIASAARKYLPNATKDIASLATALKGKLSTVKGSDLVAKGWEKYVRYEGQAKKFVSDSLATESGVKIKSQVHRGWDWLKGLILKKPAA